MIPNVIHHTFGLSPDFGGKPFGLIHDLSVRSAHELNQPSAMFFWYQYEPSGPWWELAKPYLTLRNVTARQEIFGNPLLHPAHRSDVLRLEILQEHGGIYIDADVICIRPFAPLMAEDRVVMGRQEPEGLCNAVMLAPRNSEFLRLWYERYTSFRSRGWWDEHWDEHSVRLPMKLHDECSAALRPRVLEPEAFFNPGWWDIPAFMREDRNFTANSYAVHLWEQMCWAEYEALSAEGIVAGHSEFSRLARKYLDSIES